MLILYLKIVLRFIIHLEICCAFQFKKGSIFMLLEQIASHAKFLLRVRFGAS